MSVYQMSMVAVIGAVMCAVGFGKGASGSLYLGVLGFLICASFLIQSVRMLQRQIDILKSAGSQGVEKNAK